MYLWKEEQSMATKKETYKRLGDYIELVNIRNSDLKDIPLMGLSINKVFIPSIANTIGTNMANYKVIKRNQFAYGPVTSRNGDKITIALFKDYDEALISQAYLPFEIVDADQLLPDYLMMWFSRPEFDRYARFNSHGSARETFDWSEMCDVELPIPPIEEQEKIVAEYQAIENKIKVNEQICEKLEATAQAIYKEWFVEFNFPDENGKPYKDNGGKMVWNEELEKDVPEGWVNTTLKEVSKCFDYKRKPLSEEERKSFKGEFPYYGAMGIIDYVKDFLFDGEYLLFSEDGINVIDKNGYPSVFLVNEKFWVNNHAHILKGSKDYSTRLIYSMLKRKNVSDKVTGAAQPKINQKNMNGICLIKPDKQTAKLYYIKTDSIFNVINLKKKENIKLTQLKSLLLARMVK